MVITWSYKKVAHGGRRYTINFVRNDGFRVINANSACQSVIFNCVVCRRLRNKLEIQTMADLPKERIEEAPPFTYCDLDMLASFLVKERRKELKRYRIILITCITSRSLHLEVCNSMETESFLIVLTRFIRRRGNIRTITSDNGSGEPNGSRKGIAENFPRDAAQLRKIKLKSFFLNNGSDWIVWPRNPPGGSHIGGIWKR